MNRRRWSLLIALGLAVVGVAACSDSGDSGGGGASSDAVVSECTGGRDSSNRIRVRVTNSGSDTADYLVAVGQFGETSGERIGTTDVHLRAVRPGETSEDFAFSHSFSGHWTCEIVDVQRVG